MQSVKNVVIGAGPAGLAAAWELAKKDQGVLVLEKADHVGGMCWTIDHKGYKFDLGGHRFFTKVPEVQKFWEEAIGEDLLLRPRLSRMYYRNKFFAYPIKMSDALPKLGLWESFLSGCSLLWVRFRRMWYKKPELTHEDWVVNRFGKRLYDHFFRAYTEKLWGVSVSQLPADWAAQRMKDLSLMQLIKSTLFKSKEGQIKSLIDKFHYPKYGPGMLYERVAERIKEKGGQIKLNSKLVKIVHKDFKVEKVIVEDENGNKEEVAAENFISSAPLNQVLKMFDPVLPDEIIELANKLRFRAFFGVELIVNRKEVIRDNWIYTHAPEVRLLRVQNFKNWSPFMSADEDKTPIGAEYVCWEDEEVWRQNNAELIQLAGGELEKINLVEARLIEDGTVMRYAEGYPVYHLGYREDLKKIFDYLAKFKNFQTIGRQGLHRYNNMDHSILTGFYAARNTMGENLDVLAVNADEEYHETEKKN